MEGTQRKLRTRHRRAKKLRAKLTEALSSLNPADTSVVVFGSLAREEVTSGSDIDWTLLVDGQAVPQHFDASLGIEAALHEALEMKPPGRGM
jgi:predicted nucleotidyltransferase